MSPGSSTESYPAFARIRLWEIPGKNLNQVVRPPQRSARKHAIALRLSEATVRSRALRLLSLGPLEGVKGKVRLVTSWGHCVHNSALNVTLASLSSWADDDPNLAIKLEFSPAQRCNLDRARTMQITFLQCYVPAPYLVTYDINVTCNEAILQDV
ncbi:hypothetical protein ANN_18288 [Periplaneta americana]|uniref:Uncharacterized protein n=1 Tax=Periplaneta americana TaxID=6978 RepID=A0ABQ8SNC2_PERAM|nr:hypothetical protein ANN_18288 [Periplaneta americana]